MIRYLTKNLVVSTLEKQYIDSISYMMKDEDIVKNIPELYIDNGINKEFCISRFDPDNILAIMCKGKIVGAIFILNIESDSFDVRFVTFQEYRHKHIMTEAFEGFVKYVRTVCKKGVRFDVLKTNENGYEFVLKISHKFCVKVLPNTINYSKFYIKESWR